MTFFSDLSLFTAKALVLLIIGLVFILGLLTLMARAKQMAGGGSLRLKNLNESLEETRETILMEVLPKKIFKQFLKQQKKLTAEKNKLEKRNPTVYVLNFDGDIKASAVDTLREEINAIVTAASPQDEVVLRLESGGGMVHGYGLAAAQLMRLKEAGIKLTVTIDKVAASGGYLMACVADHILAAPFAIIGSIGVIVQLPNFNRLLKEKNIDFEMETAGEYKRTITMFGENTDQGREKLKEELEEIHDQFKQLIVTHRPSINIDQVATGEHWLGQHALTLKLVDTLKTSDAYLLECSKTMSVYELQYVIRKPLLAKLSGAAASVVHQSQLWVSSFFRTA